MAVGIIITPVDKDKESDEDQDQLTPQLPDLLIKRIVFKTIYLNVVFILQCYFNIFMNE